MNADCENTLTEKKKLHALFYEEECCPLQGWCRDYICNCCHVPLQGGVPSAVQDPPANCRGSGLLHLQPRRNRQLYSYHQQMSLTAHLTLKCSDLHVHPPPQFRQISSSRAVTAPPQQHISSWAVHPTKEGNIDNQTDRDRQIAHLYHNTHTPVRVKQVF